MHGDTIVQLDQSASSDFRPIKIETPRGSGHYAVSYPLSIPVGVTTTANASFRIVVDVEVEAGRIGLACATADLSSFVARELKAEAGARRKLYVPATHHGAALVIRNMNSAGQRSAAKVFGIDVRAVDTNEIAEESIRVSMSPHERVTYEIYPPPRLFAIVSWGQAGTHWLARALNDCPGVFCLHGQNFIWHLFGEAKYLDGLKYLQIVGIQGSGAKAAGDVHGISREAISDIRETFGDRFRSAVLVRDPLPRLRSELAYFKRTASVTTVNLDYLEGMLPEALRLLPTGAYPERLFVHATNMLNAVVEEIEVGPIFRMEDVTNDAGKLRALLAHVTAETVEPPTGWAEAAVRSEPTNRHNSEPPRPLVDWQLAVLKSVVRPKAVAIYRYLGYDMDWLLIKS